MNINTDSVQTEVPLTFKEAMAYLRVSKTTLTKLLMEKKIRAYKPTSKIIIYRSQLIEDIQKLNYSNISNG